MNFTYELKKPKDNAWGSRVENGTWTGMIGSLVNKDCDIGKYGKGRMLLIVNTNIK